MAQPSVRNDDDLEKLTEQLMLQLIKKFMQVKDDLVRSNGNDSSWSWFYDAGPYPLASSIIQKLPSCSLEESDIIYLIATAIFSELKVGDDRMIRLDSRIVTPKIVDRLRAPVVECEFSVPISMGGSLPISLDVGGPHKLTMQNLAMNQRERIALSGRVNAIHEHHASRQIEADIKSVLGVLISMGIAQPLPLPVYEIPLISFPNWPALLSSTPGTEQGIAIPMDATVGALASRIQFAIPTDLNELENKRLGSTNVTSALECRLRGLSAVLSNNSERSKELQSAACLIFDAFATADAGKCIAFAFMSMEAVLLDPKAKESIIARLSEAVAYRLGTSANMRRNLRKQVSKLYDARSAFVHTGKVEQPSTTVNQARGIAADVLRREILDLDDSKEN